MTYFLETDYASNKETLDCEDLRQFYIRREILRSISGHTCPKIYHLDLNTFPFLLIICDELQEWGRPRFEDYKSGNVKDEQQIKIQEFEIEPKGKIHIVSEYTELEIDDLNQKKIEKEIIRRKFQNLHYLLRSAKDDTQRIVDFRWEINLQNRSYVFRFDTNKTSYEMVESYSIPLPSEGEKKKPFMIYEQK